MNFLHLSRVPIQRCPLVFLPQIESGGVTHEHTMKWRILQGLQARCCPTRP